MTLETNPARAIENVLRSQGYSAGQAKTLVSQCRAELQQQANAENQFEGIKMENTNVAELVGQLNNAFAEFKASHNADVSALQKAVDDMAIKAAADEMTGPSKKATAVEPVHAATGLRGSDAIRAHYTKRAEELGEGKDAPTLAEFVRGVAGMKTTERAMASLAVGTDTAGGYAVPVVTMPKILDALAERSALLRAGASILPMEGAKSVTTAAVNTIPTPSWRNELGNVAEASPTFRPVTMTPRSLAFIIRVSRELLMDAPDMDRALRTVIAQAFAAELDRVGLVGSGTAPEPHGIYGLSGVNTVAQVGTSLAYTDLLAGYQAILEKHGPAPTAAIVAPRTLIELAGKPDANGQPLNLPPLLDAVRMIPTTGVPTNLGTGTDESLVFLGDFRTVQFGMRESLSIQLLREAYSSTGEIGFLCHARADVAVNYPGALSIVTGVK
ncbi:phage major capsid protein [Frateuria soli]|uniref:phage major capsid protein n=1 Tax=Frateuria soli TaxID=1542730 RepID=UPI001E3978C7|nr:phage major capsid protein [Frateuria soli]UGB39126.1 phage major capsid protein [Frateuria soli]